VTPQNWQTVMTEKGHQFFSEKIGVTPSVAASGDAHPSDGTEFEGFRSCSYKALYIKTDEQLTDFCGPLRRIFF